MTIQLWRSPGTQAALVTDSLEPAWLPVAREQQPGIITVTTTEAGVARRFFDSDLESH
jgi:hypothetical protein